MTSRPDRNPRKDLMRVTVRGQTFDSVRACADHFRIRPVTVYTALHRGAIDTLGLGKGTTARPRTPAIPPKPIILGQQYFPSLTAASAALGKGPAFAHQVLRRRGVEDGTAQLTELWAARMMQQSALITQQRAKQIAESDRTLQSACDHEARERG